jgi:GMP synthase-like glutamine amidotransferase
MKPVLIIRHAKTEGPGFLGEFLSSHDIPFTLIKIDEGDEIPETAIAYSGIAMMGGPMSVNDDLPWIAKEIALVRDAAKLDIPLIGHCLGGQMMSKALGAKVSANPVKEIGWGGVFVRENPDAKKWFGDYSSFLGFHWHGETFDLPIGATHLLSSHHCMNQAWSMGKHLAMQCHIEMTEEMVISWCDHGEEELKASASSPAVEQATQIKRSLSNSIPDLNEVAYQVYSQWIKGLSVR